MTSVLKRLLPDNLAALAHLLRTEATLRGLYDSSERTRRLSAVRRLMDQRLQPPTGQRALIFSFRGWHPHVAWEAILGHAMRLNGITVDVFNCGGPLPICEVNFRHASPLIACAECAAYPKALISSLGLSRSWLRQYISADEADRIRKTVAQLRPAEYEDWTFDGRPAGRLVRDSVLWFLRQSRINLDSSDARIFRDFLIAGAQVAIAAPRLIARTKPHVVLELNGQFFAERIFNSYVPSDVPIVTYEAGWRSDTLGFDRLSPRGPIDLDHAWEHYRDQPLTPDEERELDLWIDGRAGGDMQRDFYVRFDDASLDPLTALGLNPSAPTAVLFTNVVWDTAVLGRDTAFPSIAQWLRTTIAWFQRHPETQLVIRIHPAEDLRPSMESRDKLADVVAAFEPLPRNIRMVPSRHQLSSYALLGHCRAAIVYTSTAGLEAALREIPVVVAARVHYARRGFTYDVDSAPDYEAALTHALEGGRLTRSHVALARRFAYLLLFRYLHRIPVVRQRPRRTPLLDPSEVELLLPGTLPQFDHLIAALRRGSDFVERPRFDRTADSRMVRKAQS